jgi:mannose-6-phosphate isomerase-like protein (cupin superfamily)
MIDGVTLYLRQGRLRNFIKEELTMKRFGTWVIIALLGLVLACGNQEERKTLAKTPAQKGKSEKAIPVGPQATPVSPSTPKGEETIIGYVGPIEKATLNNNNFRQVLCTGKHSQLVLMCLQPGEEIGKEMHADVDQFFRIESGNGKFVFGEKKEYLVGDGDAVVVPAGTYHNVINISSVEPLKLYTIYSPPIHPDGTVHKTKAEAEAAEHH